MAEVAQEIFADYVVASAFDGGEGAWCEEDWKRVESKINPLIDVLQEFNDPVLIEKIRIIGTRALDSSVGKSRLCAIVYRFGGYLHEDSGATSSPLTDEAIERWRQEN